MADKNIAGISLSLMPGMSVDLEVKGFYARTEPYEFRNETTGAVETKTLIRGFYVEDEEAGTLSEISGTDGRAIVRYTQNKTRENAVWFISLFEIDGEPIKGVFKSIYVPVHDHASIVTGGPAYGTYQSEGNREVSPSEEGT